MHAYSGVRLETTVLCILSVFPRDTAQEEIKKLTGYWERKEPIVWVNYHYVAEHAKFPHKPHIRYGLECTTCHGNVEEVDIPKPIVKIQMGWCISCHEEKLDANFKEIEANHKGISELSDLDKRIMSHTGRIRSDKLYKDYDHQLGDCLLYTSDAADE